MTIANFEGQLANLPVGSIISWHDSISTIPNSWALCDGNNGTPDLIEKFPKGVPDTTTDPGSVGGENSVTLTESQLPSHSHNPQSTGESGEHNHDVGGQRELDPWSPYQFNSSGGFESSTTTGAHKHTASGTASQGGGGSIDNQPAYEETLFIKRIE
jgi:hypothetical protein